MLILGIMETTNIRVIVAGRDYSCPVEWTVEEARNEIQTRYSLIGGAIENNGIPVLGSALIGSLAGPLTFIDGQPAQPGTIPNSL